jgi:hypothetical protein
MLLALAVAGLAARRARVAFHPVLGLVDGKHMSAGLVVTEGAFLITVKGPIGLGYRGHYPDKTQDKEKQQEAARHKVHLLGTVLPACSDGQNRLLHRYFLFFIIGTTGQIVRLVDPALFCFMSTSK